MFIKLLGYQFTEKKGWFLFEKETNVTTGHPLNGKNFKTWCLSLLKI